MSKPVGRRRKVATGFTLVELVLAMAVFSFMLLIIVQGMINIVRMHNQAIASNIAQDNARSVMEELVQNVRNSSGVDWAKTIQTDASGNTQLCLQVANSAERYYWVVVSGGKYILYRNDNGCTASVASSVAVSNDSVNMNYFQVQQTTDSSFAKQEVHIAVTVSSSNGTATPGGAGTQCQGTTDAREFCSVVNLSSGAVPR